MKVSQRLRETIRACLWKLGNKPYCVHWDIAGHVSKDFFFWHDIKSIAYETAEQKSMQCFWKEKKRNSRIIWGGVKLQCVAFPLA